MARISKRPKKEQLREEGDCELYHLLKFGMRSELVSFVSRLESLAMKRQTKMVRMIEPRTWQDLKRHFKEAWVTQDGSFFRELATAIEEMPRDDTPEHPEMFAVLMLCRHGKTTYAELKLKLKREGKQISTTQLKRYLYYINRKAVEAKGGRPRIAPGKVATIPTASNGVQLKRRTG